jgi:hypothetical protein
MKPATRFTLFSAITAFCLLAATAQSPLPKYHLKASTSGPKHHFFGYYGIPPWNKSQTHRVALESDFQDHLPEPHEAAAIGLVNATTGGFRKIGETRAWNLQQGAMLHWNSLAADGEIIFNDRKKDNPAGIISIVLDVKTGMRRELPRAVSAVSRNGRYALSLTYGRLRRMRPVVGYVGAVDPNPNVAHPENDGVFLMDLKTGESKLAVSIGEVHRRLVSAHPDLREFLRDRHMWFNHTVFNKDDTRFFFLARCWKETPQGQRYLESAMFTANLDGSDLREVVPFGKGVSHFEWRNAKEIMATFTHNDGADKQHVLFTDGFGDYKIVGEGFLKGDGHCSFAPDSEWMVTDRNHGESRSKLLMIFHIGMKQGLVLGTFPVKEYFTGDLRCDLHPRWNRTGDAICFDALETKGWTRQLHVAYLNFK